MGPECAAQQAKKVSASTMNGVERKASATPMRGPATGAPAGAASAAWPGACRTKKDTGTSKIQTRMPIVSCAVRQSLRETSHAANGDTVMGATPRPADTSDTARPRWRSNHDVTAAIMGAKKLPAATPTSRDRKSVV